MQTEEGFVILEEAKPARQMILIEKYLLRRVALIGKLQITRFIRQDSIHI